MMSGSPVCFRVRRLYSHRITYLVTSDATSQKKQTTQYTTMKICLLSRLENTCRRSNPAHIRDEPRGALGCLRLGSNRVVNIFIKKLYASAFLADLSNVTFPVRCRTKTSCRGARTLHRRNSSMLKYCSLRLIQRHVSKRADAPKPCFQDPMRCEMPAAPHLIET